MSRRGGHLLFWLVLAGGLAADLLSKHFVFRSLSNLRETTQGSELNVWPGVFRLTMRMNPGGPFSLFSGHTWWLVGVSLVALGVILYLYLSIMRRGETHGVFSLALIGAGALGNLVDRLRFEGHVRDFIELTFMDYPVFNVADVLITLGVALLVIELLRHDMSRAKREPADVRKA
ncbi:MAG TPA: signal peptidase II [Planctomycetota bacterium]|nr:signal peptidase II [Planctomycetota bacterium]